MKYPLIAALAVAALFMVGCEPTSRDATYQYKVPDELKDCTATRLRDDTGNRATVFRCPNSTTTTTSVQGKTNQTTVVIDGVTFVAKEGS